MVSQRRSDSNGERELAKYMDEHFYSRVKLRAGTNVKRLDDLESQYAGIDVEISNGGQSIKIDEKAALYYVNRELDTFAFELSFVNKAGRINTGWFMDDSKMTTHYLLLYPKSSVDDLSKIQNSDFRDVHGILVSRAKLKEHLESMGYTKEKLQWYNSYMRSNVMDGRYRDDGNFHFSISGKLYERPVNLILARSRLEMIADAVFDVSPIRFKSSKGPIST